MKWFKKTKYIFYNKIHKKFYITKDKNNTFGVYIMNNKLLDNLEKDLEILIKDKFHQKHNDLIAIVFGEDIKELIKFARKVNLALENKPPYPSNNYQMGYNDCDMDLRKQIYGE